MRTLVYLLPLLAVVALMATRRVSLLHAGVAGWILSWPAAWLARRPATVSDAAGLLFDGAWRGTWIAWQAVSIILGGVLLYQVLRTARPELFAPLENRAAAVPHRSLFTVCFLLGPFVEAATGFGVGYLITLSALLRMGVPGLQAACIGLFSQMMVPWGALAVGTYIGAELAELPVAELGRHSAVIYLGLLPGYLLVFWWILARDGRAPAWRERVDDVLWLAALCGGLYLANRALAVEVAALVSTGPLLVLRTLRDRPSGREALLRMLRTAAPYAALTAILVLTRTVPGARAMLEGVLELRPAADLQGFAPLYHASFWLLVVALGYGAGTLAAGQWRGRGAAVWQGARVPVLVSVVFLMMAETLRLAEIPQVLAQAWVGTTGALAVAASPVMGLLAGALTASNTASNGMLMALQIELAQRAGADAGWIAAVQNVAGSNAILISPVRIAMGCALVGLIGREGDVYRRIWPLALVLLVVLELTSFLA
jgi:lactate permease